MSKTDLQTKYDVVVVGGGFAGLGAAFAAKERLGEGGQVALISPNPDFVFSPSLIWVIFDRPLKRSSFLIEPALASKGISFIRGSVREVRPATKELVTEEGSVSYERLIIATGGRPDTKHVPGLAGQFRAAAWMVGEDSSMDVRNVVRHLYEQPGPLVIGAARGASYESAAYELALLIDRELRSRGIRERVPMTFVTDEPYLGELGFGQSAPRGMLAGLFAERDITVRTGVTIADIEADRVTLATGEIIPSSAAIIMPPLGGVVDIWKSAELTDERGLVPVNTRYQHVRFPDIYAAGVAARFTEYVEPLGDIRPPHTGYLSLRMGAAAGRNAAASLGYGQPVERALPHIIDIRVIDGGDTGVLMVAWGDDRIKYAARRLPGTLAHALKTAIEQYQLRALRRGQVPGSRAGKAEGGTGVERTGGIHVS